MNMLFDILSKLQDIKRYKNYEQKRTRNNQNNL